MTLNPNPNPGECRTGKNRPKTTGHAFLFQCSTKVRDIFTGRMIIPQKERSIFLQLFMKLVCNLPDKTRQPARQDNHKIRQDKTATRQDKRTTREPHGKTTTRKHNHKARQSKDKTTTRQDKTRQDKTRQGKTSTRQDNHTTRQSQDKTITRQDNTKRTAHVHFVRLSPISVLHDLPVSKSWHRSNLHIDWRERERKRVRD